MFSDKKVLLLDMNSTFMFGEDRFGESEDFSIHYYKIGGSLPKKEINLIIRAVYSYLDIRYPNEKYQHNFPTLQHAIQEVLQLTLPIAEIEKIISTFSFHELGYIPKEYSTALHKLKKYFVLAVVIDIWAPKQAWLNTFKTSGINNLFSAMSFSSDHGMVKPSSKPFQLVLDQLGINNEEALVIGDSIRRDLGGARAANIDCVLVGGAKHSQAISCYKDLLEFSHAFERQLTRRCS